MKLWMRAAGSTPPGFEPALAGIVPLLAGVSIAIMAAACWRWVCCAEVSWPLWVLMLVADGSK